MSRVVDRGDVSLNHHSPRAESVARRELSQRKTATGNDANTKRSSFQAHAPKLGSSSLGEGNLDLQSPFSDEEEQAERWFSADTEPPTAIHSTSETILSPLTSSLYPLAPSQAPTKPDCPTLYQRDPTQESWDDDFVFSEIAGEDTPKGLRATIDSPNIDMQDDDDDDNWGNEDVKGAGPSHLEETDTMTKSTSNSTLKAPRPFADEFGRFRGPSTSQLEVGSTTEVSLRKARPGMIGSVLKERHPDMANNSSRINAHEHITAEASRSGMRSTSALYDRHRHTARSPHQSGDYRSASDFDTDRPQLLARHRANRSVSEQLIKTDLDAMTLSKKSGRKGDNPWSAIFSGSSHKGIGLQNPHLTEPDAGDKFKSFAPAELGKRTEQEKKPSHRKAAASLSVSLGFSNPWSRSRKSNKKEHVGYLDDPPVVARFGEPMAKEELLWADSKIGCGSNGSDSLAHKQVDRASIETAVNGPQETTRIEGKKAARTDRLRMSEKVRQLMTNANTPVTLGMEGRATSFGSITSGRVSAHSTSGSTATSTSARTISDTNGSSLDELRQFESLTFNDGMPCPLQDITNRLPEDYSKLRERVVGEGAQHRCKETMRKSYPAEQIALPSESEYPGARLEDGQLSFPTSISRRCTADMQARITSDPCDRSSNEKDLGPSIEEVSRRNSLGDFKIPTRIVKAQENIRSNMIRVKEFAQGIEDLKALQVEYQDRLLNNKMTHRKRIEIEEEYGSWWECAEVLIGLGEGKGTDDEALDVSSMELAPLAMSSPLIDQSPSKSRNRCSISQTVPLQSEKDMRSTSSRASSSRSIAPQREAEILSAMLAGAPITAVSSSRPSTPHQERTLALMHDPTDAAPPSTNSNISRENIPRHHRTQSQNPDLLAVDLAGKKPQYSRSHSQQLSPRIQRPKVYHHLTEDGSKQGANQPILAPVWTVSTESVNTQGTMSRRARLRSAGRAGLQGLRELLRTLKVNPALEPYMVDSNTRSSVSLARTATTDSRITMDHLESPRAKGPVKRQDHKDGASGQNHNEENGNSRIKGLIRSHSVFRKSARDEQHSHHVTDDIGAQRGDYISYDEHSSPRFPNTLANKSRPHVVVPRTAASVSHLESSIDSDWTEADYEAASCIEADPYRLHHVTTESTQPHSASGLGKRRFVLFPQRSTSASIVERHLQKGSIDGQTSIENTSNGASRRQSLQSAPSTKIPGDRGGKKQRSRTSSTSMQVAAVRNSLQSDTRARSTSVTSTVSMSEPTFIPAGRRGLDRPSMASTVVTFSGNESTTSSSGTQTESGTSRGNRSQQDPTIRSRRRVSSTSTPSRASRSIQAGKYKKLILQAEAIPSLLVYIEATKERCQECIELLHLDLPPKTS